MTNEVEALRREVMELRAMVEALSANGVAAVERDGGDAPLPEYRPRFVAGPGASVSDTPNEVRISLLGASPEVDGESTVVCGWRYEHPSSSGGTGKIQVLYGHPGKDGNGKLAIIPETYGENDAPTQADIGEPKWTDVETVVEESY